jgi:predicted metal-dependent HD superfamily phosphohydrolase
MNRFRAVRELGFWFGADRRYNIILMGEGEAQLRDRWEKACDGTGSANERQRTFRQLYAAYTGADRFYHGIGHIAECLRELDPVRTLAASARAIELAIWFHDVIYDGRRKDNEERSAELADGQLRRLEFDRQTIDEIHRLILLTRHDRVPPDVDGKLMVDIDLSSLGRPADVFENNTRLIRKEFPHVPDADFARGRREMLGRFLARPRIYYTDVFRDRYEATARENLSRALARL